MHPVLYYFALLSSAFAARAAPKPALGWSTWNALACGLNESNIKGNVDAMVELGIVALGFTGCHLDDCWMQRSRDASGSLVPDPAVFPSGFAVTLAHIKAAGMTLGLYTARGNQTCQGRPGTLHHEAQDAAQFAAWGATYLKLDSCGGYEGLGAWEEYSIIAAAQRAANGNLYIELCEQFYWLCDNATLPHGGACYGNSAYTLGPWLTEGLPVDTVANALLVEWENTFDSWASTMGNFDAQFSLTSRLLTFPGVANHLDMLTVCMGAQSIAQYRAQLSLWAVMGSPLILGNDFREADRACVAAVLNAGDEVIAVDQDDAGAAASKIFDSFVAVGVSVSVPAALVGGGGTTLSATNEGGGATGTVALPGANPISVWWQVVTRPLASGATSVVVLCREAPVTVGQLVWAALACDAQPLAAVCASIAAGAPLPGRVRVSLGTHARHEVAATAWDAAASYLFNASLPLLGLPSAARVQVRDLWAHAELGPLSGAIPLVLAPNAVAHVNVAAAS